MQRPFFRLQFLSYKNKTGLWQSGLVVAMAIGFVRDARPVRAKVNEKTHRRTDLVHFNSQTQGPIDPDCPADFTSCFEDGLLKLLPAAFLLLVGIPRLFKLQKLASLSHPCKSWKHIIKMV